ncbi:hypothetical protein [Vagococcus xieshaowenii]|uniref:DUF4367 domain-containing protein n=1 Tax=Vagococcus xieshaowenii TaxID=2562451 RepID=A0ABX5THJ9_9ENTE|nr:hypothetical protein [Vagococcus xieshaowenii]QCA29705.1 hypothetical protein E4Z98_09980 [Vagococcus xieshaowenii]
MLTFTDHKTIESHTEYGTYKGMVKQAVLDGIKITLLPVKEGEYTAIVNFYGDNILTYHLVGGTVTLEQAKNFIEEILEKK